MPLSNGEASLAAEMAGYGAVLEGCKRLTFELFEQLPIGRKMHLLSSNGRCAVARTGYESASFAVLAQAIDYLGEEIAMCISEAKVIADNSVELASNLVAVLPRLGCIDEHAQAEEQVALIHLVYEQNRQLSDSLRQLDIALSPMEMLVKKGEYLALFASVEAGNAIKDKARFDAIGSRMKTVVSSLTKYQKQQGSLLNGLLLSVEQQHLDLRTAVKAA